jgi:DNA invertase Pin-like site-specific DNA recombinase
MSTAPPPLAFLYDRCLTENAAMLELRCTALAEYVEERGWAQAGVFVDYGDAAMTNDRRPSFEELLRSMARATDVDRVCLVYDWGRLSHDAGHRQVFTRRVLGAGGWLASLNGETVRIGAVPDGRLTSAPQAIA